MKSGIDWFPLDVALDSKWELIEAEFGLTGFGVVVHLLQEIYGKEGYYIEWTEEVALLFARRYGVGGNVVSEIVGASIRRGLFDKNIFDQYRILTSKAIQKRYFEAINRRKEIVVDDRVIMVNLADFFKNVNIKHKNVNILDENDDISKQSRVEKSRVEKSNNTISGDIVCRTKDVRRIQAAWNSLELTQISKILPDTTRGKMLRKRVTDYGVDAVLQAIENVRNSSYLVGNNDKGWTITFDWFIKPNNFPKVLDGNYNDNDAHERRGSNGGRGEHQRNAGEVSDWGLQADVE